MITMILLMFNLHAQAHEERRQHGKNVRLQEGYKEFEHADPKGKNNRDWRDVR